MHWFLPRESIARRRWSAASELAKEKKLDSGAYAETVEREILPFWEEAHTKWAKITLPTTSPAYESLQFVQSAVTDRVGAYTSLVEGLKKNDREMIDDGLQQKAAALPNEIWRLENTE